LPVRLSTYSSNSKEASSRASSNRGSWIDSGKRSHTISMRFSVLSTSRLPQPTRTKFFGTLRN